MKRTVLFVLALLLAAPVSAESGPKSVYRFNPYVDGAIIATGGLGSLFAYCFESRLISFRCPCNPGEVIGLDRPVIGNHSVVADTISDITVGMSIAVPFLLSAQEVGLNSVLLEDLVIYAEVFAVNAGLVTLTKNIFQRPLPRTYEGTEPGILTSPSGYRSFYSGHTSSAFSMLTAMSMTHTYRHGFSPIPWIITGVVGTSVAVERVLAGKHFYTDVIVGAIAGATVGFVIPLLHRRDEPAAAHGRVYLSPAESGGLAVTWLKRF